LFSALAKANVNVRATAQGASEYNITVVIDSSDSARALKSAHAQFYSQVTL
jgi:bifunctional aspartokinase / homoserine dehydrogenase 1